MTTTLTKKKQNKVATTIRLDPDLKDWARNFASHSGTDISTLITITLKQIQNGDRTVELVDPKVIAYNKYLDDMTDRIERGEEKVYGPFEWEDAITFLSK
jgi:antitoxin component of RelBE/YafQ-DinJ toxin-antitoxin module